MRNVNHEERQGLSIRSHGAREPLPHIGASLDGREPLHECANTRPCRGSGRRSNRTRSQRRQQTAANLCTDEHTPLRAEVPDVAQIPRRHPAPPPHGVWTPGTQQAGDATHPIGAAATRDARCGGDMEWRQAAQSPPDAPPYRSLCFPPSRRRPIGDCIARAAP